VKRIIHSARVAPSLVVILCLISLAAGQFALAAGPKAKPTEALISPPPPAPAAEVARPRAYLFRGALGPIFSRGIDRLTDRLQEAGITADVYEFTICQLIAAKAVKEYRESPAPIVLIGHSMGGLCTIKFAETLESEGIKADLVIAIDPAHATGEVPPNVDRFMNIFLSKDVLGGGDVKPKAGYRGHYASFDLSQHDEVSHITIEKSDTIQQQIVAKVLQLTTTRLPSDSVPIRYVIPPKEPIDLWDDGFAVLARPGDSLESIAATYHVPLWSVAQINKSLDRAPLAPGARVVVPRHIEPMVEASVPPPPPPPSGRR
jgi:hypothetical protein